MPRPVRNDYPKDLGDSLRDAMQAGKIRNHDEMLEPSSNSKKIETTKSGHEIHLTAPGLVVDAIREIIDANHLSQKLR